MWAEVVVSRCEGTLSTHDGEKEVCVAGEGETAELDGMTVEAVKRSVCEPAQKGVVYRD